MGPDSSRSPGHTPCYPICEFSRGVTFAYPCPGGNYFFKAPADG